MAELEIVSPHDGAHLAHIPTDDASSIDRKVGAAAAAMSEWSARSPMARAEVLLAIAEATRREFPRLARELSLEQGKTVKEALLELDRYVGPYVQYAGLATAVAGRHVRLSPGVEGIVERRPVGVVAGVVPWNFPASLFGSKVAPALAAGCGFLIKPAESTSLITLELARLANEHLPEGLLDVVIGDSEVAAHLVGHPGVTRVAFTGSTAVGKSIAINAGSSFKRLSLELGGCDPFVVCEDADLPRAVRALMGTRFYNAGQVCVAPKRLIAHRSVIDEVTAMLTERIGRIVVGPSDDETATMGPLHTSASRDKLEAQIDDAVAHGATLIGGGRPDTERTQRGWFMSPALLVEPSGTARVRVEETFGPVLTVLGFESLDEAVGLANETTYGLGASVWSGDHDTAWSLAHRIESGYTWINALGRVYDELPFGGVKASGVGREHGVEALDSYLEDHTYVIGNAV